MLSDLPAVTPLSYSDYVKRGGYAGLSYAIHTLQPAGVLEATKASGLRGRGGAGFPTAKKWEMVLSQPSDTKYFCCNGAEDEPGTFKDRYLLRSNPHQLIEGAILAAFAIGAKEGYLYINGSFDEEIRFVNEALSEARDHGHVGITQNGQMSNVVLHVVKSPGTYVAGEETALLEVIEGRLAKPQQKPPYYPAIHGLFGKPTVVNNLETTCNIPHIVREGADWYKKISAFTGDNVPGGDSSPSGLSGLVNGDSQSNGTMVFTLTGHVNRPGLYELPLGTSLRELIEEYGGGVSAPFLRVKAVFPGGPSNALIPADQINVPLDFDSLKAIGSGLGTGAVIVFSEASCMVKAAITYTGFFAKESCGQCPPCHLGLANLTQILQKIDSGEGVESDIKQAEQLCSMIKGRGYCYLLTGAVLAVESILRYFKEEFLMHIQDSKCPFVSGG